jgi:hypothetical protein
VLLVGVLARVYTRTQVGSFRYILIYPAHYLTHARTHTHTHTHTHRHWSVGGPCRYLTSAHQGRVGRARVHALALDAKAHSQRAGYQGVLSEASACLGGRCACELSSLFCPHQSPASKSGLVPSAPGCGEAIGGDGRSSVKRCMLRYCLCPRMGVVAALHACQLSEPKHLDQDMEIQGPGHSQPSARTRALLGSLAFFPALHTARTSDT